MALKKAEQSDEVVAAPRGTRRQAASGCAHLILPCPSRSAREVNGQEQPVGSRRGEERRAWWRRSRRISRGRSRFRLDAPSTPCRGPAFAARSRCNTTSQAPVPMAAAVSGGFDGQGRCTSRGDAPRDSCTSTGVRFPSGTRSQRHTRCSGREWPEPSSCPKASTTALYVLAAAHLTAIRKPTFEIGDQHRRR